MKILSNFKTALVVAAIAATTVKAAVSDGRPGYGFIGYGIKSTIPREP